ncbi:MAG TPA: hypothetical protein DEP20_00245 [Fusobacteria bacterium]|nr:hypothetical protein [Fusobacteriota bacterium]|tara:strand:+ start:3059 stop:3250 length:192 start_codon:yes stop_codon:yes gene_type:complete
MKNKLSNVSGGSTNKKVSKRNGYLSFAPKYFSTGIGEGLSKISNAIYSTGNYVTDKATQFFKR